jgi:hypothetical protein
MPMDGLDGINNRINPGSPNAKSKRRTFSPTDPAAINLCVNFRHTRNSSR